MPLPRPYWLSCAYGLLAAQASALTVQFHEDTANPLSAGAWQGFQTAASLWENAISTQATLNIFVGMHDFGVNSTNIIGQADAQYYLYDYKDFRQAVAQTASSTVDYSLLGTLPSGLTYSRLINQTNDTPGPDYYKKWIDTQSQIYLTSGNAKALGLISPTLTDLDAFIEFNSVFAFDYNRSNGISYNQVDFIGAATHEIGHALGFNSIVDYIDTLPGNAVDFLSMPLDFMRYSTESSALGIPDVSAGPTPKYLRIGNTILPMATGTSLGDGNQASHFKDNQNIGVMDPSAAFGEQLNISSNDLTVMDALGWSLTSIPEPSTYGIGLSVAALIATLGRRRRRILK